MINPQLLEYVRQQLATGVSEDVLKKALVTQGWNEQDASEAFGAVERPTPSPIVQPFTQTSIAPINQSVSAQPKTKRTTELIFISVIVLILILGAGSVYAFYKFNLSAFAWLKSTSLTENNATPTGGVYEMYCGNNVPPLPQLKMAVDIKTAKYDEVKTAIDTAVSQNDTEQLGLLYYFLSRYLAEYQNSINFQRAPAFSAQGLTPSQLSLSFDLAATSTKSVQEQWLKRVSTLSSTSTPLGNLFNDLTAGNVKDAGLVLGIAGYREIMEQSNLDEGLPLIKCAAEHYYDDLAMHNLGQMYRLGEQQKRYVEFQGELAKLSADKTQPPEEISALQELEGLYPEVLKSSELLPVDNKQSLFWALAAEVLDPIRHRVFTDSMRSVGWNNIAVIDTIVNTDVLTRPEMQQVECQLGIFLSKRYPDLGDSTTTCTYEPDSKEVISSYLYELRYSLVIRHSAMFGSLKDFSVGSCRKLGNTLFDDEKIINTIKTAAGGDESRATCAATDQDFAVSVPLQASPKSSWCIDNTGAMKEIAGTITDVFCK